MRDDARAGSLGGMLKVLDHNAIAARRVPAGRIIGPRPGELPDQRGERLDLCRRAGAAQDGVAIPLPQREGEFIQRGRHCVYRREARLRGGGRRFARQHRPVAGHHLGARLASGGDNPADEFLERGAGLVQPTQHLPDAKAQRVDQDAARLRGAGKRGGWFHAHGFGPILPEAGQLCQTRAHSGTASLPPARTSTSAAAISAMPSASCAVSASPNASHPAATATAGWVSSAKPMTSGVKWRSA